MAGKRRLDISLVSVLLISLMFTFTTVTQNTDEEQWEEAARLYDSGQYQGAILIYEAFIEQGWDDDVIYFNLGNAYYHSGQLGYALLNYRRAQEKNPRDNQLTENIARIRAERVIFQQSEQVIIDRLASATLDIFTLRELATAGLITWITLFIAIGSTIVRKKRISIMLPILVITSVLAIICNGAFLTRLYVTHYRPQAIVLSLNTDIYSGPGYDYLILGHLHSATEVRIVEKQGIWRKFILPNGDQGWITEDQLQEV